MPFDDKRELFWLVDKQDNSLGFVLRKEAHKNKKLIHRAVFVLIFDEKNRILLQKRSRYKDMYPEYWTVSSSGHVNFKESYQQAARRELREELGLNLKIKLVSKKLIEMPKEREYVTVFKAKFNDNQIIVDETEISDFFWASEKEVLTLIERQRLTPGAEKVLRFYGWLRKDEV